ncbi:CDP-6-deoxy-D-xylo-4-hexulose-3-dehydrase [Diaminobutyricimonas aerilata]|uniref:CDP-6-deoxy-D-xylo-4-hexulose-3-dehydrase n=1 Tax=Diaminobutyricimonas aerilata TaxID=1162967 RepID=A0A2M9CH89_9MICO|nr:DegT/DnrJ/EryC1/StrS family aminotransferase [Diaminobutyricimonas aerilata]PJJ71232.1 CDP-6-deoxy-D-xylo-4-hexulose-3-dehydrase [Diaminobutyricimonas aerilata]
MTSKERGLPLATTTWDDREYAAIQEVVESGRFTMGPRVAEFERQFAEFVGARSAVMVNSGSSANLVGLTAAVYDPDIPLGPGDEILVPAVSWATTYYPVTQLGMKLRFVDVDEHTLNIDLDALEQRITPRTKAVFAVNLLGNPVDFARLRHICDKHDLVFFEDNCESLGAQFEGRHAGTHGLFGTFSSFFSHHISTMEGGLVVSDRPYIEQASRSLRAHGWTRELAADNLIHPKSDDPFEDLFRFVLPGYNVRPVEMSGAIGSEQIRKLPDLITGRQRNAETYVRVFAESDRVDIQHETGSSSWFGFALLLKGELEGRRKDVVSALTAAGVEVRPIVAGNFARNPVIQRLDADVPPELPNADRVHHQGLFIGNHHYDISSEIETVAEIVEAIR